MRAVRVGPDGVTVDQVDPTPGEGVRVKVRSAGICGSDLHLIGLDIIGPGVTLGHEIAGYTENGTPVAIEPLNPCFQCAPCVRGEYNLCRRGDSLLFGIGLNGGMADEVLVPERALVPLPAGLDPANASLVEPLAVLVHSLRRANLTPNQRVAVVGGGTIGLCAVAAARALGCEVALSARRDHQRAAGERLGATEVEGEYDLVVEAAGSAAALATAIEIAKPGAEVAIPGIYWGDIEIPGLQFCLKQINLNPTTLYGRHAGGRDADTAAAILAADPAIADTLITHRYPLSAAPEAFETATNRASGSIKVVLEP